jgi:hypothetical protein
MILSYIRNSVENDMLNNSSIKLSKKHSNSNAITSFFLVEKKEKPHIDFTKKLDLLS